jgi:hypothetical protein
MVHNGLPLLSERCLDLLLEWHGRIIKPSNDAFRSHFSYRPQLARILNALQVMTIGFTVATNSFCSDV